MDLKGSREPLKGRQGPRECTDKHVMGAELKWMGEREG